MGVSERLRSFRKAGESPASVLSVRAGLSQDMVRQIEAGLIKSPSAEVLVRLADALGVPVDWLIAGRGPSPSAAAIAASRKKFDS